MKRLVDESKESIDLTAVYWNLLPDVYRIDEEGFSARQFENLGARHGRLLYQAMMKAAERGVKFRILQSPGFNEGVSHESDYLIQKYLDHIHIRQLAMADWYDAGIMHQKMWVFDRRHAYIGLANMDWKSITQVKELGIVVEDYPETALDAQKQFEAWWKLARFEPSVTQVFDPKVQVYRTVPRWSKLAADNDRILSPLAQQTLVTKYNIDNPMPVVLNGQEGSVFITNSPSEICAPDRVVDLEGIWQPIQTAESSICISVMNYVPLGLYRGRYDEETGKRMLDGEVATIVWWPVINDALLQAVITRGVYVRLLVSQWSYTHQTTVRTPIGKCSGRHFLTGYRVQEDDIVPLPIFDVGYWRAFPSLCWRFSS